MRSKAKGKVTVGSVEDKNGGLVNSTEEVCEECPTYWWRCGLSRRPFEPHSLVISSPLPVFMGGFR